MNLAVANSYFSAAETIPITLFKAQPCTSFTTKNFLRSTPNDVGNTSRSFNNALNGNKGKIAFFSKFFDRPTEQF